MNDLLLRSSAAIAISALLVGPPASADILEVFAKGVNPNDATTYNNVQQGWLPTCWAAAGSNVIGHWQQHHAPESTAPPSAQEVYNTYLSIYATAEGGVSDTLYRWWLGHHHASTLGGLYPIEPNFSNSGGYYRDIYTSQEAVQNIAWRYSEAFGFRFSRKKTT